MTALILMRLVNLQVHSKMQVNPKIQYNEEDPGLTLDNPVVEPAEKSVSSDVQQSNDTQDEADLLIAEQEQKIDSVEKKRSLILIEEFFQSRKNDKYFAAGCMAAGVLSVVFVYFFAVFM